MPDSDDQTSSRAYLLPVEDTEFLLRDEMRGTRFMLEYEKAELSLRDWGVRSTIVVFGSARTPSPEQAAAELAAAKDAGAVERAKRRQNLSRYYQEARNFGRIASLHGGALCPGNGQRDNVIATRRRAWDHGGGQSRRGRCRGAQHRAEYRLAARTGAEPLFHAGPDLPVPLLRHAQDAFRDARQRPGRLPRGFGTMDELFEILTLEQTRKAPAMPVVLLGRSYWERVVNFDTMVENGMVDPADLELFSFVDTAEEAWAELVRRGLKAHTPAEEQPR